MFHKNAATVRLAEHALALATDQVITVPGDEMQFACALDARRAARAVSRARALNFEIDRMIDRLATLYRNAVHDAA